MRIEDLPKDPGAAVWVALIRASTGVQAAVQAEGKAAGFPPLEWYDVLWELERGPAEGRRPFELESRLLLAQYNLSRLIDRLERAGYVGRQRCPSDGRGQVLVITESGRALRKAMWSVYSAAIQRHVGDKLDGEEARTLCTLLLRLMPGSEPGQQSCSAEDPATPPVGPG
jgi:DNA-binding MarR family transcriptional regulator